jgi:nondiscriminating aspartyl-tRNA synthetase
MDLEVRLLQSMLGDVRRRHSGIGERAGSVLPDPARLEAIPRIDHAEAREIAARLGGKRVLEINPDAERVLCDWAGEEHGVPAVFVTGFPRRKRPFYTWPEGQSTRSFDLLYGGLEITTGGQRINRLDALDDSIQRFGLDPEALSDYRSIFRYGCPPHGGFAIGLERLTQKICGLESVKLASAFPRDRNRTRP